MKAFDAMLAAAFKAQDEAAELGRVQALLRAQAEAGVQTTMSGAGAYTDMAGVVGRWGCCCKPMLPCSCTS